MRRDARLVAQPRRQLADDQADGEHDGEGEDVLDVGDGERQRGGTKKKSNASTLSNDASAAGPRP